MNTTTTTHLTTSLDDVATRLADATADINATEQDLTALRTSRAADAAAGNETADTRAEIDRLEAALYDKNAYRSQLQTQHADIARRVDAVRALRAIADTYREDATYLTLRLKVSAAQRRLDAAAAELQAFETCDGAYAAYVGVQGRRTMTLMRGPARLSWEQIVSGSGDIESLAGIHSDGGDTAAAIAEDLSRFEALAADTDARADAIENGGQA